MLHARSMYVVAYVHIFVHKYAAVFKTLEQN